MGAEIDESDLEEEVVCEYRRLQKEEAFLLLRKHGAKCEAIKVKIVSFSSLFLLKFQRNAKRM